MRIFNYPTNTIFDEMDIYLTPKEIEELISKLNNLLENMKFHHIHLSDYNADCSRIVREITISVYTENNLMEFDDRSRRVITENK